MNNRLTTNLAFIILIVFLLISAVKAQKNSPMGFPDFADLTSFSGIPAMTDFPKTSKQDIEKTDDEIINDFENMTDEKPVKRAIDKSTALAYVRTTPITGTEMLAMARLKKFAPHLNKDKVIVVYVDKGSDRDIQAFMSEFSKTRSHFAGNSKFVFLPLTDLWEVDENNIKNSHDRVTLTMKRNCGYFCILDTEKERMIKMKGSNVNKKSAEIIDVILKSL